MSRSELHDWEWAIGLLCVDNADKMLAIAQDIYNTAFARGKNYISLESQPCEDAVSRTDVKEGMQKYGFHAPDMTVTEFVEDCLSSVTPKYTDEEKTQLTNMRDATEEERKSVKDYVDSVSKPTVVNFNELLRDCGTCKHNTGIDCGQYPCNECNRRTYPLYEPQPTDVRPITSDLITLHIEGTNLTSKAYTIPIKKVKEPEYILNIDTGELKEIPALTAAQAIELLEGDSDI